ncbi:serine hydrolase [Cryomorphaceae bacterium 1068]|nr:serine hydrolase [Cryomorphaceae bacterium 1068]
MKCFVFFVSSLLFVTTSAQTYFPPAEGNDWETMEPSELNWCQENIDTLFNYLEEKNSRAFIILKDGRIVLENYFNGHDENTLWYWASAAKTITATLTGKALEDELLSLDDPVSQYIGTGWTSCDSIDEYERTIFHQLTMSSSFNNSPFLWDCTEPGCYQCTDAEVGTEWHYHNAVYRRLIEVVEAATGIDRNDYTNSVVEEVTGMTGFWVDNLYFSKHRDMARFGWLAMNGFEWDGTAVLTAPEYIQALTTPSQLMNQSYGYLWWLNGQSNHMFPLDPVQYEGSMIPSGPDDMYMALGANDQKIYVVPSQGLVVTRQGDAAFGLEAAASAFDVELWELISNLECSPLSDYSQMENEKPFIFPNPSNGAVTLPSDEKIDLIAIYSVEGRLIEKPKPGDIISLPKGTYLFTVLYTDKSSRNQKVIVQ